jgi:hypothetical protein
MSLVHPRSSALHAGLVAAFAGALSLTVAGCFKNDGGTGSGGSESSGGASGSDSSGEPATSEPATQGSSGDGPATTGATTTAPATTGDATTGEDTSAAVDCDSYCDLVMQNCDGDFLQYGSIDNCLTSCTAFPPGSAGDMSGNSLACRHYHAGAAAMANDVHCGHAGPGGDTACGSNCEGFCAIAGKYCPAAWADDAACLAACATFSPDEVYDAGDVSGNTFACRLYHATAASLNPDIHCGHITGDSPACK